MKRFLTVEDLWVRFKTRYDMVEAVRGVSFSLGRERLGIVGESGSGKSMTGRALLGLVRPPGDVSATRIDFLGQDLHRLPEKKMRHIRGKEISMVMQDPKYSLNPVLTVGEQITEAYRLHNRVSQKIARAKALEMLEEVQIRDPERVYKAYPSELSGGMGQRVMIAMMLIPDPKVLIADEPTSALDVTVQLKILQLLDQLVEKRGMGLIFISHDLPLVSSFCDRILIMYGGRIVETCRADQLDQATHPYTRGLLQSLPDIRHPRERLSVLTRDESWKQEESVNAII
ncbi:ABC transporter ATP-binding protein [Sneathiella chinensis]|uniref:ABC transporter ATP-binding protein n=1 Tax=Sneathiella chinensis TaxID=349750 RepID=A0ABQ5U1Q2_9PROT|nr:ABC transporter ATP-binding protein [Sneathiella chinensis]GLQ06107.1 ABC transporter ATP-binding protein [Sneathiella chinensis]